MTKYLVISVDKWGNIVGYSTVCDEDVVDKVDIVMSNTNEETIAIKLDQLKELIKIIGDEKYLI